MGLFGAGDYAAGNSGRRAAGGSGGDGVNDDRRATIAKNGAIVATHGHVGGNDSGARGSVGAYDQREVGDIAEGQAAVSFAMSSTEVRTGRLEIGRFTLRNLVDMKRMLAGREILDIELNSDTLGRLGEHGTTDALTLGVLDVYGDGLGSGARLSVLNHRGSGGKKTERDQGCDGFHHSSLLNCRDGLPSAPRRQLLV
jgi:hypothetical protein